MNTADADPGQRSIRVLRRGGTLISLNDLAPVDACEAASIRCLGPDLPFPKPTSETLAALARLADAGKFRVHVERVYPLATVDAAWQLARQRHTRGKLVIGIP